MSVRCFACKRVGKAKKREDKSIQIAVKAKIFKDYSARRRVVHFTQWRCATSNCRMNGQWIGDEIIGSYLKV